MSIGHPFFISWEMKRSEMNPPISTLTSYLMTMPSIKSYQDNLDESLYLLW